MRSPRTSTRIPSPEPLTPSPGQASCLAEAATNMAAEEEEVTKEMAPQAMSPEGRALSKATKVEAAVQIWPGLASDSAPSPGWATAGLDLKARAAPLELRLPLETSRDGGLWLWVVLTSGGALSGHHPRPATCRLDSHTSSYRRRRPRRVPAHSSSSASPPPSAPPSSRT